MKLQTHYLFSAGLLTLVNVIILHNFYSSLLIASIISVIGNTIIDNLGHEIKGNFIRRTPRTHTIPRSILWGLLSALPVMALAYYLDYPAEAIYYAAVLTNGAIAGPSHMLLDVFTEKGIYVKEGGRWKRFALAHFKYDDPIVNGLAALAGVIMLFVAMQLNAHVFYHYYHYYY